MIRYNEKILAPTQVIQIAIKESGKSCYQISKESGLTKNSLKRWENGECLPSADTFEAILDYMGYDLKLVKRGEKNWIR